VANEIGRAGPNTLFLTLGSLVVTLLLAVPVALYSATRASGARARALRLGVYLVSALPVFWLGYVVIYVFIHRFGVFPLLSGSSEPARHGWLYGLLPIVVLGVANGTVSEVTRHLRGELGRVLTEDYIRTARAKGAPVWRHAFKEGFLLPMTEMIAAKIPFVIGGAVIVEQVFNWPGLGRMVWQAAQDRDFPVIMGIALVAAAFVRLASLLRGVVYAGVNPRTATE
jgi:peptide/nickel transport system permease protein